MDQLCAGSICVDSAVIDFWFKLAGVLTPLVIGLAAAGLALQQFKLSRAKLKFDLYEKRLALFNRAQAVRPDLSESG